MLISYCGWRQLEIKCDLCLQKRLEELLFTGRFFKDDFAVVLQPFLKEADPPRLPVLHPHSRQLISLSVSGDESEWRINRDAILLPHSSSTLVRCFLSPQNGKIDMTFFTHDCFHFTIKGHEELAKGVWNNMVRGESLLPFNDTE